VYVSNESPQDVFFDNLTIQHHRGPLLEENHYYPFGLIQSGTSSKAAGKLENERKFVEQLLDGDLGLNWYQFKYRNHDPQIGRFIEIDPLANEYAYNGTYNYAEDRPIDGIDLEGKEFLRGNTSGPYHNVFANPNVIAQAPQNLMLIAKTAIAVGIAAVMIVNPAVGIPLAVGYLSGAPVTPSPQAFATELASEGTTIIDQAAEDVPAVGSQSQVSPTPVAINTASSIDLDKPARQMATIYRANGWDPGTVSAARDQLTGLISVAQSGAPMDINSIPPN